MEEASLTYSDLIAILRKHRPSDTFTMGTTEEGEHEKFWNITQEIHDAFKQRSTTGFYSEVSKS